MKTWYSKHNGWTSKKPNDWLVPKKTSDNKDVYIGDYVIVYRNGKHIGAHKVGESKTHQGCLAYADGYPYSENDKWMLK